MVIKTNIASLLKSFIILSLFCLFPLNLFSQDQHLSDSLKIVFKKNQYDRAEKLRILDDITYYETNPDEIIIYSKELVASAEELDSINYICSGYLQWGNAYRLKGSLTSALEFYYKASKVAEDNGLTNSQANVKVVIADAYSIFGDSDNAVSYYRNGIALLKKNKDTASINLASAQLNLGDEYYKQMKLDSALYFFKESNKIFKLLNYDVGEAYNLGGVGLIYVKQKDKKNYEKAEESLNEAIKILTTYEDYSPICEYLNALSDIYLEKNQIQKALTYAEKSLELSKRYSLKKQMSTGYLKLSKIFEKRNDYKKTFSFYKNHIIFRDSVNNVDAVQKMANAKTDYDVNLANEKAKFEIEQKQTQVNLLNEQKKTQTIIIGGIAIALILIGFLANTLYKRNKFVVKTSKIIETEKERSDDLLRNILPEETALELKENGVVKAKKFDSVSVLFTDFKGFTEYSENLSPEELVKTIDFYFSKFDEIIEKHGLEKIKTVGDAYMCASGLPFPVENHAFKMVKAAFDIIDFVNETMSLDSNEANFDIRVGINSGSVVAGVVGTKKFAYDIWGDTVNVASRMESSGEIGRINISEATYQLIKNNRAFKFESRGAIEAKGKGKIEMYFVSRIT